MKLNELQNINKIIHEKGKLAIMVALSTTNELSFNELKQSLEMTDGNLSVHISNLQKSGYIEISKSFFNNKPLTKCRLTSVGKTAFKEYINSLEKLVNYTK